MRPSDGSFVALMYHSICADGDDGRGVGGAAASYFVDRSAFERQLRIITDGPGRCVDCARLVIQRDADERSARPGEPAAPKQLLLTFDDGWADCVDIGGPLLEAAGANALLFVTSDFIDRPRYVSAAMLRCLHPKRFRVGSHARSHCMLSLLPTEEAIRSELLDSKRRLEDLVGYSVDTMSVPNGAVDARVRRIAGECGFRTLFDSTVRINRFDGDPMSFGRVAVKRETTLDDLSRFARHAIRRERARRALLHMPKRLLGLRRYDQWRRRILGGDRVRPLPA